MIWGIAILVVSVVALGAALFVRNRPKIIEIDHIQAIQLAEAHEERAADLRRQAAEAIKDVEGMSDEDLGARLNRH